MMNGNYKKGAIGLPNTLASDGEKASEEYGLRVGRAIEEEWFRKDTGSSRFINNRDTYHRLRQYSLGEQSVQKYKNELAINGDISYLNLDWTPVPIIPKFVDVVVNGMSDRLYDIKVDAIDPVSSNKKAVYKNRVQTQMRNREDFQEMEEILGSKMFSENTDNLPESSDELDLHMITEYKDDIEIANEKSIESVLKTNNYEHIKKRVDYDQVTLGISAVKHSFNRNEGVKVEYVDPANMIWSPTEDPKFGDCYYFGEVKNVNITELKKIDPSLTQSELEEIAKMSSKADVYPGVSGGYNTDSFDKNTATLLYFCYKTDKNIVYKKKKNSFGTDKVLQKDDSFNPPKTEQARFEKLSKKIDVWYEGVLVLNTNYLLKWEMMKNMVRPKSAVQKVYAPYIVSAPKMYRGRVDSLVKRMIPFADQIQLTHLKLQQVTSKMIPDGVYLDIDGLSSINLGNGNTYNPQEALNLFFQTGSVIGRSMTEEGEFNHGKIPVQELTSSGANGKISSLVSVYNYNLEMIRSVTGLNEARDGSTPDSKSLVGVQKLAALNSNTATRHVLQSGVFTTQRLAECVSYRISDILEYSDFTEDFIKSVGKYSVELMQEIKDLHLHDFGIFIELHPDEEEKQILESNIQASLSQGKIDIDDAIDVRNVKNVKIASQLLKVRKKRKEKKDQQRQQENMAVQAEAQNQASMALEAKKQEGDARRLQLEAQLLQMKNEFELARMDKEAQYKIMLLEKQGEVNNKKQGIDLATQMTKENFREDRKDKRTEKQASQQSKMIQQRQQDLDPIDFDGQDALGSGKQGLMGS
tara:strand:- start:11276 stop:13699 length:2424 start_codon:yes stop_codon:yes gene_type:complete